MLSLFPVEKFFMLKDQYGRVIKKLRYSLTDKCNLRCHYCMPVNQTFKDEKHFLSLDDSFDIIHDLYQRGVEEIRFTGGEPLMRSSFSAIMDKICSIPFKKRGLTTNGIFLDKYFDVLKRNNIYSLNISLDSLNSDLFKKITYGDYLDRIIKNILLAKEMGFFVKINVVMMKGVNDHELLSFIDFSAKYQIEIRFLELMRIGYALPNQTNQFISANELILRLKNEMELKSIMMPQDSTSFNFLTPTGAQIGFIASESQPFCGQCSRWRLSSDGVLRACLLKDDGLSVKGMNQSQRNLVFDQVLGIKPERRPKEVFHTMNTIGG